MHGNASKGTGKPTAAERYEKRLLECFTATPDKHEAHRRAEPVLEEMARSPEFLTAALEQYVARPENLNLGNYPVVGIEVASNPYFELVVHAWIPLPDGRTDLSTKSIHHHGEMLLSTVAAFGPGYEHWLLARPTRVDPEKDIFHLDLVEHGQHELHRPAFVDAYTAHVPLYPPSLTVTICLWSAQQSRTWRDSLKQVPLLRRNRDALRRAASRLGLTDVLQVKTVSYFDYYPTPEGFVGIPEREEFGRGPNSDHLHSLFHVLQETGNSDLSESVRSHLADGTLDSPEVVSDLLARLDRGKRIDGRLSEGQYDVPTANFTRSDIEEALSAQDRRAAGGATPVGVSGAG